MRMQVYVLRELGEGGILPSRPMGTGDIVKGNEQSL
jgi:hypothetical protein